MSEGAKASHCVHGYPLLSSSTCDSFFALEGDFFYFVQDRDCYCTRVHVVLGVSSQAHHLFGGHGTTEVRSG